MNRELIRAIAGILCLLSLFVSGCGPSSVHVCEYTVNAAEPQYLKSLATCMQQAEYYYSCSCGEKGEQTFAFGELGDHEFSIEIAEPQYLKCDSTVDSPALYYKLCACGEIGTEVFEFGEKYPALSKDKQALYKPTSLTVTLYDPQKSVYGFTFNTSNEPLMPVLQIKKADATKWSEYALTSVEASSYTSRDVPITYYISKAEIALEPNTSYIYRAYDKRAGMGTAETTLTTKNANTNSFTVAHVSDSQGGPTYFSRVLSAVTNRADFLIHTGDVVETSKYEEEWTEMLDANYAYLSRIPMMAISGNHETTYKNGSNETFKHFHNSIPEQTSTDLGYFYSFVYGDVKFIMLNTNALRSNKLRANQYQWLENELKTNPCKWTVVAMHNPMYSVGKYGADSTRNTIALALREQLQQLFVEHGVDLVLQGHDHAISRTFPIDQTGSPQAERFEKINGIDYSIDPSGVIYVMNGPAGNQTRDPVAIDPSLYSYAQSSKAASWAELTFDGDTLTVTVKYHTGEEEKVYHQWGIKKTA